MPNKIWDVRTWIEEIEEAGELKTISGANREEEIGGIVDIFMRKMTNPALLFDDIPGYEKGYRVLANILTSVRRVNVALGLPADTTEIDLVQFWRKHMNDMTSIPPTAVNGGPVLENLSQGDEVDILKIPSPKWHEEDGGNYIGTACMVIMKDPDSDWINLGCYRVQAHDSRVASVMTSKGKHGNQIISKYRELGEPCPVAVVLGMHPTLFMVAGMEMPHGQDEYDIAGGLMGQAMPVINGPVTGLPIPAQAELAFEGYIPPDDLIDEGPFGEWAGYYASGARQEPAIRIESLMHRDDPILVGAAPAVPPNDNTFWRGPSRSGAVWNQLEAAGISGVQGVWTHEAGGGRMWLTISIKQAYPGHSKQAGLIASQC
ncbi:MAG: UbiD family decarboxylase, partial [Rhodospirillales bacterium]|nr:UbiD family decarboxylase [Rhodospirillales bacterium]